MRIFTPLPGEYIASALKRGNELLGIRTMPVEDFYIKPIARGGFGRSSSCTAEWRDEPIFKFPAFLTAQNIAEEVLDEHTLQPLNAALGRNRAVTNATPKIWMKICTDCVLEDHETHGSAFIHRRNVQSAVEYCSVHGTPLLDTCPRCLIPLRKHDLTKLGICGQKYKRSKHKLNFAGQQYAKFVADLLNYKGDMVKRGLAGYIVRLSTDAKYRNELKNWRDVLDLAKITKRVLNRDVTIKYPGELPDHNFPIFAYLGCETAERYLELLSNAESRNSLHNSLVDISIGYTRRT